MGQAEPVHIGEEAAQFVFYQAGDIGAAVAAAIGYVLQGKVRVEYGCGGW
jgi:hypothetical protein